ncbi:ABC transporter substrate-binding protein [Kribbella shirazensis]|uniref:Sorbitol/mannitol transport system substrate-binding protein n=1 Tax=Kribbella shirazensis TaxID=1105143 RepID=A0A7X5VI01_9ACTN|nr:extracellular solute-binding protein [Kribbella shirazensis]NIK61585.1 sorbitol/mannitol transport system substrate-binding protein [Kribbella shirazensis]
MSSSRGAGWVRATLCVTMAVALAACGAGSRTGSETATKVACDFEKPAEAVTVDVLAYNSSAIDPYTNTMVASCSKNGVTVKHEPIDFGGQVQKTTATLAGETGTYDVLETYGFVIPQFASGEKLRPLNELFDKYSGEYGLDKINKSMRDTMSYDGKLYALPMQAQMYVLAYRKDVFDKLGLKPPTTFAELRAVSKKIQDAGEIKHPLALPWLASSDIITAYDAALGSLGTNLTDPAGKTANLDTPQSKQALQELLSLRPFMDPEVTTFDQPAVQQQLFNGSAAIGIMFSGRMADLVNKSNTRFHDKFAFAPPPKVAENAPRQYSALSVDGWSIPRNTKVDPDLLFQVIASSVSEEASKASMPAAYPARDGMVSESSSPYAAAANDAIKNAPPAEPYPWTSQISNDIRPVVADVLLGKTSVDQGTRQMQQIATKILAGHQ